MFADDFEERQSIKLISDILCSPGRHSRPLKLVIIMRGPPGSGKTHTAKLIKVCIRMKNSNFFLCSYDIVGILKKPMLTKA